MSSSSHRTYLVAARRALVEEILGRYRDLVGLDTLLSRTLGDGPYSSELANLVSTNMQLIETGEHLNLSLQASWERAVEAHQVEEQMSRHDLYGILERESESVARHDRFKSSSRDVNERLRHLYSVEESRKVRTGEVPGAYDSYNEAPPLMRDAVMSYLVAEGRPVTTARISREVGGSWGWAESSVRSLISKMARNGEIGVLRRGVYFADASTVETAYGIEPEPARATAERSIAGRDSEGRLLAEQVR